MEGGRTVSGLSVVHVHVNAQASQHNHNSLLEKTEEQRCSEIATHANYEKWPQNRSDFFGILSNILHYEQKREAITDNNSALANEDEYFSDQVGKSKFQPMLQVEKEGVPSRREEAFAGNSHVAKGCFIDVVANSLNAVKAAHSALHSTFGNGILATCRPQSLGNVIEAKLDEANEGDDESANANRADVLCICSFESEADLCGIWVVVFALLVVEVVSGGRHDDDKLAAGIYDGRQPK